MGLIGWGQHLLTWLGIGRIGVGLDIGTTSIKVTTLARQDGACELLGASLVPVAGRAEATVVVADAIRRAVEEANATGCPAATALSGAAVTMRLLEVPAMSEEDLHSVVPYRAQEVMPVDLRRSRFDFTVVARTERMVRVLAVAAPEAAVERVVALARQAGVVVTAVEVDALAVVNCFLGMGPAATGDAWRHGTVGLLHVGASLTSLAVLAEGALDFCREIVIGADAVAMAEAALEDLANEVRLSLEYRQTQAARPMHCLVLGGGGVALPQMVEVFEEVLRVPVLPWDPTEMVVVPPALRGRVRPVAPQFAVSLGLALRGVGSR